MSYSVTLIMTLRYRVREGLPPSLTSTMMCMVPRRPAWGGSHRKNQEDEREADVNQPLDRALLGGKPKCFLNSREKVYGDEEPTRSATSPTE